MSQNDELKRLAEAFPADLDWDSNTEPFFNGPSGESLGGGSTGFYCVYGAAFEIDGEQYDGHTYVETCKVDFAKFMVAARDGVLDLIAENERLSAACTRAEQVINNESKAAAISTGRANLLQRERDELRAQVAGLKTGYEAYERVNAELKAECERLGAENTDIESAAITYIEDMQEAHHENERLKAEVDSLTREADRQYTTIEAYRKDAERLQWLLKNASIILDKKTAYQAETGFIKFDTMPGRTETALAIDAAMGKGEKS